MQFAVLGPLEVRDDSGEPLAVSRPKQRTLLSILLLNANQPVSADRLVEGLWGARLPGAPHGNLKTHVWALRRLFGAYAGRLRSWPGGYLLHVAPEELDLLRFQRLVTEGREAAGRGRPRLAAEAFGRALALWRGTPLGDVTVDAELQSELERLEDERLAVVEAAVGARLELGEHTELVGELSALVAANPLREGLCGQLMVALGRGGRRVDALAIFRTLRERLVDELGVEPGPSLQELQRQLLSGDAPVAGARPGSPPAVVPRQLPPDVTSFVGREKELAFIRDLVEREQAHGAVLVAIDGAGGVGKSTLAIHAAHRLMERFPDGQLYLDLQGATAGLQPLAPVAALGRLLRALGVEAAGIPDDVEEAAAQLRSLCSGRRLLMVLDNAAGVEQVRSLRPAAPGCVALITGRQALPTLDGVHHLHLDILQPDQAVALLAGIAGQERVAAAQEAAARIAELCGLLPLALRVAGGRLAARTTWPLAALAERLAGARRRLDELQLRELDVRASLSVSYRDLPADPVGAEAARTFRMLGLVDSLDAGADTVAALCDLPATTAEAALERLADEHLVEPAAPGRYRLHDLLRLLAREHAESEEPLADRNAAIQRLLDHHIVRARQASITFDPVAISRFPGWRLPPGTRPLTYAEAILWVDAEHANLTALASQAAGGPPEHQSRLAQLATALFRPFDLRGYWRELIAVNRLSAATAAALGDRHGEATALKDRGAIHGRLGQVDQELTYLQRALAMFVEQGDRARELSCLNWIGVAHGRQERNDLAASHFERSLAIARELGDRSSEGDALNNLGIVYQRLGRLPEAIAALERDLEIDRELGNGPGEGVTLNNLADAYSRAGRLDQAIPCYQQSLDAARQVGDRLGEASRLWGLGEARHHLGQQEQSRSARREALTILRELDMVTAEEVDELLSQPAPDIPRALR